MVIRSLSDWDCCPSSAENPNITVIHHIIRAIRIAMNAPDTYGSLVAVGIAAQLAIQTILNIAVATSSVPNTGVALPFFSYGGTAIITLLCEMGVLLNISRHSVKD